jgi:hypothetical protein
MTENLTDELIGKTVEITNFRSAYYGQCGVVVDKGFKGGVYVRHDDGETVYHPWGYGTPGGPRIEFQIPDPYPGTLYGLPPISQELLDYQRQINGIHDDIVDSMALGMFARYKRPSWFKRLWRKVKTMMANLTRPRRA